MKHIHQDHENGKAIHSAGEDGAQIRPSPIAGGTVKLVQLLMKAI